MAGDTTITVIGNLTNDPELRFTPSGSAVSNFTVASTPRSFDKNSNEWKDGETLFLRCAAWRELGEHVAESIVKGMRVIVTGRLKSRQYETKEGEKRTVIELEVDEIGPSLKYGTAKFTKDTKGKREQIPDAQEDPWATPTVVGSDPWGNGPDSEPPF
jgi:single-strand DNA-binding protein